MGFQELALLLLLFLPLCSAQSTYYVTPTPETPCPGQPCFSFSEYISGEAGLLNSTDLTFVFLPGDHIIENSIPFGPLSSLNLFGDSASFPEVTSVIICGQPSSFTFSQISRFNISGIAFKSCGNLSDAPMKLEQVFQAEISKCLFQDGQNGALAVVDSTLILLQNKFENNSATSARGGGVYMKNCTTNVSENAFIDNSAGEGGGIYLEDSMVHFASNMFKNNVVLTSDIYFDYYNFGDSILDSHGGGVYMKDSTANVIGNIFINNSASKAGGGVYLEDSTVYFASNVFNNNVVLSSDDYYYYSDGGGGALAIESSHVNILDNSFANNSATSTHGGGVYMNNSTANVSGNIFMNNSATEGGGAVSLEDSMVYFTSNVFNNNVVLSSDYYYSDGGGGALAIESSHVNILDNSFTNNSATSTHGGSVYMINNSTASVSGNMFINNSASWSGGGVYLEDSTVHFASNVFNNNVVLSSDDYYYDGGGGALTIESSHVNILDNSFINNSATSTHGGGVYIEDSTANFCGNIFINNSASGWGGGVYLQNSVVSFNSNRFENNTASYGGGIEVYKNGIVSATNNTFTRNIAGTAGGGIDIDSGVVATFMDNILEYNQAQTKGGGFSITSTGSNVSFTLDSFISNTANKTGGGIWIIDGIITVAESNFIGNSAGYVGGGSYLESGTAYFRENMFINNSALFNGAGMYIESNTDSIECTNNTFRNNWGDGWVLFIEDSNRTSAVLIQNTFEKNTGNVVYGSSKETPSIYNVIPSPDTLCPNEPCLTISEFIDQANQYIALNTTLMFLPGTHTVKSGLLVEGITSLTLLGNNTSVQSLPLITCDRPASLGFKYIDKLFVHSLAFDSCGDGTYAALSMKSVFSVEISDCNFKKSSGGAVAVANCSTLLVNNNVFENNSAIVGGGLYVNKSTVMFRRNTFTNNTAELGGAGVILFDCSANYTGVTIFTNNSVSDTGREIVNNDRQFRGGFLTSTDTERFAGGAMLISNSNVTFPGNISIENNSAENGGGIMVLESNLTFSNTVCIRNNTAMYGGGVYVLGSRSTISFGGLTDFVNNSAKDSGGAVYAMEGSKLNFTGPMNISFINNTALNGGGLYLDRSFCFFSITAQLYFAQNHATESGGAIYVYDSKPTNYCEENLRSVSKSKCFFQVQSEESLNSQLFIQTMINFSNNTADEGGGDLYGGTIDNCNLPSISKRICSNYCEFQSSGVVFDTMTNGRLDIASEPLKVTQCGCEQQTPHCSQLPPIYPGKTINVSVSVVGQRNGRVSTIIQTDTSSNISIQKLQKTQISTKSCSELPFTVFSSTDNGTATLMLSTDGPCSSDYSSLVIQLQIRRCPPGFQKSNATCDCDERLKRFTDVTCDINNGMVFRPNGSTFWVGYDKDSNSLILHPECPFDYCTENEQYVNVDDSDTQCNYNRTGKLCGGCGGNTSLVLGSSRCMQCSNSYLALIIAFAVAGIVLVLFLFILKLTVAVGIINGLIFYANLVQVNSSVFYKSVNTNILTVFISWLNLDLGIETCFYNGMDVYTKTWLQFVFPIYVWLLVGVIIFISHFSQRITKLLGSNPIAVLATLFLISYAKILRTIIAALSFTYLEYPDRHVAVWPYDGNIEYLSRKHTPLFITALLSLMFLFLPFTLLLFLGQWLQMLQAKTEWRILSWINKPTFRTFLDAYHAPYASSHRYWTGLLLLVRCIIFIILATTGDTREDLFAVSTAVTGLITFALATTGIYRNRYFGILEASFFLNLVLLTTATNHVQAAGGNQAAVTLISLSIAFITFAGIVIYHIYLQVRGTKLQGMVASQAKIYSTRLSVSKKNDDIELVGKEEKIASNEASITTSYVELREPLLDEN